MGFTLDTSGDVGPMPAGPMNERFLRWSDLSPFTQGYTEALWSAVVELRRDAEDRIQMNLDDLGFRHLAPETLARIIADCEAMVAKGLADTQEQGRAAWEVRQAGITIFPPLTVQLGDDGKMRFTTPARSEERRAGE